MYLAFQTGDVEKMRENGVVRDWEWWAVMSKDLPLADHDLTLKMTRYRSTPGQSSFL